MNAADAGQYQSRITDLERLLDVARHLGATVDLDALLETIAVAASTSTTGLPASCAAGWRQASRIRRSTRFGFR